MKLTLRVVKLKNAIMINIIVFFCGCLLTLSLMNVQSHDGIGTTFSVGSIKKYEKYSLNYVAIILTAPNNEEKRNTIRNTWLNLINADFNSTIKNEDLSFNFKHFFVIGTHNIGESKIKQLEMEQLVNNDILFLSDLEDQYTSLTKKLLLTLQWLDVTFPNLLYLLKCDDDSFVRLDTLLFELNERKKQFTKNNIVDRKRFNPAREDKLYWGYFKGNARIKLEGKWAEPDWILCDRYLPYALGGGYVISGYIIRFIAKNANDLHLYKSEDASVGVWTAPITNINRIHDERFDTEWASRGCEDSFIIRHKQSPKDMKEMYSNLIKSKGTKLCTEVISLRSSYQYNWKVLPSSCCNRK